MNSTTEAPQDSVLRRHWEASRQGAQPGSSHAPSTGSSNQANNASSGGFFSWLKSLFS